MVTWGCYVACKEAGRDYEVPTGQITHPSSMKQTVFIAVPSRSHVRAPPMHALHPPLFPLRPVKAGVRTLTYAPPCMHTCLSATVIEHHFPSSHVMAVPDCFVLNMFSTSQLVYEKAEEMAETFKKRVEEAEVSARSNEVLEDGTPAPETFVF